MALFDDALGHGPEGPTYRPPVAKRRTLVQRTRAWVWYRWGWGHRPTPTFEDPEPTRHGRRRA